MPLHFFSEIEDTNRNESINRYKNILLSYIDNPPSLSEALKQMFKSRNLNDIKVEDLTNEVLNNCIDHVENIFSRIKDKYNNISKEDAYIICSYTYECIEDEYCPYKILNENLVSQDRKEGVRKISKYLYIFLKALRKLPRYRPNIENKYLYRCIRRKVKVSEDENNPQSLPYKKGNLKTFWSFTSTSSIGYNYAFLNKENTLIGTRFKLLENKKHSMWGYDISVFNFHYENEILLEPETQFKVEESIPELNGIIDITCEIKKTPLILDFISNNEIELESKESIIPIEIEYELDESNILRDFESNRFGINRFNDENIFRFNDNNRHRFDFQFEKNKMKISRSPNEKNIL